MAQYRCPALGDCDRANSGELSEHGLGDQPHCPSCNTPLELVEPGSVSSQGMKPQGNKKMLILAGGGVAVVAIAATVVAMRSPGQGAGSTPTAAASSPAPVVAVASAPAATGSGIAPNQQDIDQQKGASASAVLSGAATDAENAAAKVIANEIIKVGIAKLAQGSLADAERSFNEALQKDPKNSLAYYNLGILRLRQGKQDEALKSFEASFMAGFKAWSEMEQDTDLAALRKDPRFTELVSRYRK